MHIDYTFHFWTALTQILALVSLITFLWKVYRGIRSVVNAVLLILDQHSKVHEWYLKVKDLPGLQHGS